jgi:hypothetical protein
LVIPISQTAIEAGFVVDTLGTHSSRTMMLAELRLLLDACPQTANLDVFSAAIVEDNVLLKQTDTTRVKSLRHLRELYGLDPGLLIFRVLRELWTQEPESQPILALLCVLARDPSLRATSSVILNTEPAGSVTPEMLARAVQPVSPTLMPATLAKIGRNTASTWTQSGHLLGRTNKLRGLVQPTPTAVAYALLLGYLCGERGEELFQTIWARLLDAPPHTLHTLAQAASRSGWLEYRHAGNITEISFRHFLGL